MLLAIAVVLLCLNISATWMIVRDSLCEPRQRIWQLLMVWLLPLIGALVVLAVHRPDEKPSRTYREAPDPGDDAPFSGRGSRGSHTDGDGD
jgi:hypothetical protein